MTKFYQTQSNAVILYNSTAASILMRVVEINDSEGVITYETRSSITKQERVHGRNCKQYTVHTRTFPAVAVSSTRCRAFTHFSCVDQAVKVRGSTTIWHWIFAPKTMSSVVTATCVHLLHGHIHALDGHFAHRHHSRHRRHASQCLRL